MAIPSFNLRPFLEQHAAPLFETLLDLRSAMVDRLDRELSLGISVEHHIERGLAKLKRPTIVVIASFLHRIPLYLALH